MKPKTAYHEIRPEDLNKINPQMLRAIHNVFRIDWMQPATVIQFDAAPTKTAVLKAAEEIKIPGPVTVLFHRRRFNDCDRKRLYAFTVSASGIDTPTIDYYKNAGSALDKSYRKGDFDDWRKSEYENKYLTVYAVFQAQEHRTPEKPEITLNEYTRYRNAGTIYYRSSDYLRLEEIDTRHSVKISVRYWYKNSKLISEKESDIIDKSGYYVRRRRDELKHRAAELKKERAKQSYSDQDTRPDADEIRRTADYTREYIAAALMDADTAGAAAIISAIHGTWATRYAFPEAEKAIKNALNHAYKDRETADKAKSEAIAGLKALLETVAAAIRGEEEKTA